MVREPFIFHARVVKHVRGVETEMQEDNGTHEERMPGHASHHVKALKAVQRKPKPKGKGFKRRAAERAAKYWSGYASEVAAAYEMQSQILLKQRNEIKVLRVVIVSLGILGMVLL